MNQVAVSNDVYQDNYYIYRTIALCGITEIGNIGKLQYNIQPPGSYVFQVKNGGKETY